MPEIHYAPLPQRARLLLTGSGVMGFLNAILTQDISRLSETRALHAGLLTPKGKLSFAFLLAANGKDSLVIDCDASQRESLMAKLSLYRLRAEVAIEAQEGDVIAIWGEGVGERLGLSDTTGAAVCFSDALVFLDPRLAALGARLLPKSPAALESLIQRLSPVRACKAEDYRAHRLSLGIAEGFDELPVDSFFPWEAGLDLLDGISLDKGCFIGQEIVSRVYRKGKVSRRLLPCVFPDASAAPKPGESIKDKDKTLGSLQFQNAGRGLALMQLDSLADVSLSQLTCGGAQVEVMLPEWMKS